MASNGGRTGPQWDALQQHIHALGQPCHLCGQPIDYRLPRTHPLGWTVDHLKPIALGGAIHHPANAKAAHRRCNMSRGTKTPDEWRNKQPARARTTTELNLNGFA